MKNANLKLRISRRMYGKRIKAISHSPKDISHKLVHICFNDTSGNLCTYYDLLFKKKIQYNYNTLNATCQYVVLDTTAVQE